jgi:hypothetical protein
MMPGRDFTGVLPTEPPWQMPTYSQHYTYDDGYTLFSGDKVRIAGRNGWARFVAHRFHPKEGDGLDVMPEGGVRFTVRPDRVRPVGKGTR